MVALLTAVHVLVALVLILFVLLQSARGTDVAGAFGGMGSQTAFGPRGTATFLSKATVTLAVIFMANSLVLAILSNRAAAGGGQSVLSGEPAVPAGQAPAEVPNTPIGVQVTQPGSTPEKPAAPAGTAPGQATPAPPAKTPASGAAGTPQAPSEAPSPTPPAAAPASPNP